MWPTIHGMEQSNPNALEICKECIYYQEHQNNPEAFTEVLGRFAAAGFSCDGPVSEMALGSSPFAPRPQMVKKCGLDKALELALKAEGYEDTPTENTGREMFFSGELELSPIEDPVR